MITDKDILRLMHAHVTYANIEDEILYRKTHAGYREGEYRDVDLYEYSLEELYELKIRFPKATEKLNEKSFRGQNKKNPISSPRYIYRCNGQNYFN